MVNKKPKNAVKKAVPKKKPAVKKKAATVQKKTTIKKATTAKAKKPVTKKVTKKTVAKKPAVKSKTKVSSAKKATTSKVKKPAAKKSLKNVIADVNIDIKTQKGSKTQNEKVVNVIDNLSLAKEQKFVTTVAGVFRKVPAVQKISVPAHRQVPIAGILNYFKRIF
jgi:hypothetical protein